MVDPLPTMFSLSSLPVDVLIVVLESLGVCELTALSLTCHVLYSLVRFFHCLIFWFDSHPGHRIRMVKLFTRQPPAVVQLIKSEATVASCCARTI